MKICFNTRKVAVEIMSSLINNNAQKIESVLQAALRADMYHLMTIGYTGPTRGLARGIIDGGFQKDVKKTMEGLSLLDSCSPKIEDLFSFFCNKNVEEFFHDLNIEYTQLFIGPGEVTVSPYESVHAGMANDLPTLMMVNPIAENILKIFRKAGLCVVEGLNEPPDHIGIELEFMYYLCKKEVSAIMSGDNSKALKWRRFQYDFLKEHLGVWGVEFFEKVLLNANEPYYGALGSVGIIFLNWEKKTLNGYQIKNAVYPEC